MGKYLGAVGIVTDDLEKASSFYSKTLGMVELQTIDLPSMKEIIMGFEGSRSAALILMRYHDEQVAMRHNNAGKLVYYVNDTSATIDKIRQAGGQIEVEATTSEQMSGAIIGFARDLDGHQLELIQKIKK